MKILWILSGLLPDVCEFLGVRNRVTCGWLPSHFNALRAESPDSRFCVLCYDHRHVDIEIDSVRYISFGEKRVNAYKGEVPIAVEKSVSNHIRSFDPDVIHIHGTEYFFSRFSDSVYDNKPVLVSLQGIISACQMFLPGGLSFNEIQPFEWNLRRLLFGSSLRNDQQYWRTVRAAQEHKTFMTHRFFAGRTGWDMDWVRYYNPNAEFFWLNETLRPAFYHKKRSRSTVRPFSIYCSAASSYPLKGAHWLLRAVAQLKKIYPSISLRIAAALPRLSAQKSLVDHLKDDGYAAYLRHLIKKLGVSDNVVLLPSLRAEEVAEELATAHLFCLPSLCENSPNSLGEAMLVGTPAIATYVGGVPSMLKHMEEGLLCPSADEAALAAAIVTLFENDDLAETLASNAREVALQRHDGKRNAKETLNVYHKIMKRCNEF